jgi:hypothetical protein
MVPVAERETLGRKTLTKSEYDDIDLWLDRPLEELPVEGFNRNSALKEVCLTLAVAVAVGELMRLLPHTQVFFDVFSADGVLDVRQLLLYLCADPYPGVGLFKALSLVTGTPLLPQQVLHTHHPSRFSFSLPPIPPSHPSLPVGS